jgi:hypothetical protein
LSRKIQLDNQSAASERRQLFSGGLDDQDAKEKVVQSLITTCLGFFLVN